MRERSTLTNYLNRVEAYNRLEGNENFGFLSRSHGFMPIHDPIEKLPEFFEIWDVLAADTPYLIRTARFRSTIDDTKLIHPDEDVLPDRFLPRAALILGFLAHAYARAEPAYLSYDFVPDCILLPWKMVSKRLGRPAPFISYFDLIAYNWRFKSDIQSKERVFENMELMYPIFGNKEEEVLYLTQTEMLAMSAPIIGWVADLEIAVNEMDYYSIYDLLMKMSKCLNRLTRQSFSKIAYNHQLDTAMDPVVFTKTMMSFAVPIRDDVPGPSGASFPTFHLLDGLLKREDYTSTQLGKETALMRRFFPEPVKTYISLAGNIDLYGAVERFGCPRLKSMLEEFVLSYSGEQGFLGVHRRRVYGFIQTSMKIGRSSTIGGYANGNPEEMKWRTTDQELESARKSRFVCPFLNREQSVPVSQNHKENSTHQNHSWSDIMYSHIRRGRHIVVVNDMVYDLTEFIDIHPGGRQTLLEYSGRNMTEEFLISHANQELPNLKLKKLVMGELHLPRFSGSSYLSHIYDEWLDLWDSILAGANTFDIEITVWQKSCFGFEGTASYSKFKWKLMEEIRERLASVYIPPIEKRIGLISRSSSGRKIDLSKRVSQEDPLEITTERRFLFVDQGEDLFLALKEAMLEGIRYLEAFSKNTQAEIPAESLIRTKLVGMIRRKLAGIGSGNK